jgi:glutathione S-transferase
MGAKDKYLDQLDAKWSAGNRALGFLEGHLAEGRDWLVGDAYSAADISIYGYTHVAHEGEFDMLQYPHVEAWVDRVSAVPGHVAMED